MYKKGKSMYKIVIMLFLSVATIIEAKQINVDIEGGNFDTTQEAHGDFNNDGYDDLVISYQTYGNNERLDRRILVKYGSKDGLDNSNYKIFTQYSSGIPLITTYSNGKIFDPTEIYNNRGFGKSLSTGDFNNDGYADLVIGNPGYRSRSGAITVLYGSPDGLTTVGSQMFNQDSDGMRGVSEKHDRFGFTLTSGDYNGDGYADITIGIPYEALNNDEEGSAGAATILYGSSNGLTTVASLWIDQDTKGVPGSVEAYDEFSERLSSGDYNHDGYTDLAIGIIKEDLYDLHSIKRYSAGAVTILYGSKSGINPEMSQWFDQDSKGVPGSVESNDLFGYSLSSGDYNNDGFIDLTIGVLEYTLNVGNKTIHNTGAITILYGSTSGLKATPSTQWIHQNTKGITGQSERNDQFGYSLSSGDYNDDGYVDLAVGVPFEGLYDKNGIFAYSSGNIHILYGSKNGISGIGSKWIDQDSAGIDGDLKYYHRFGVSISSGDFNGDGISEIAVSSFRETAVTILNGSKSGVSWLNSLSISPL